MIDTHTHIYLPEFDRDREGLISRALEARVQTLLLPAIDASTHAAMMEVEGKFLQCRAMMGLHPCSVREDVEHQLEVVHEYLQQWKFVAVGEIGLDFYWDKTYTDQQYEAFRRQIGWALEYDLPISIHSREATDECIAVVREFPGLRGVFHCFSGNEDQARRAIDTGFYLGIGGVVTFKNSGLDRVLAAVGLNRVVLETDAPYLAPVPYRGKRNEPSYLPHVVKKLAEVCATTTERVEEISTENARELFRL